MFGSPVPLRVDAEHLPLDDRPTDHRVEWWYFFGELRADDGPSAGHWSFVTVLLKKRLPLPGWPSAWLAATQIVDVDDERRIDVGTRAASSLCYDDASFQWTLTGPMSPVNWSLVRGPGEWGLSYRGHAGLDLAFAETGPAILVGDGGVVHYGGGHALGWYTRPFLDATGTIDVGWRRVPVHGHAWMERQWGPAPVETFTWRYLTLKLEDGLRLLFFHTRVDGVERAFGTTLLPDGSADELHDVRLTAVPAASPRCPPVTLVEADGLYLLVSALRAEQLIVSPLPATPSFYEGFSRVTGVVHGRAVTGVGMTELRAPSGDFVRAPTL